MIITQGVLCVNTQSEDFYANVYKLKTSNRSGQKQSIIHAWITHHLNIAASEYLGILMFTFPMILSLLQVISTPQRPSAPNTILVGSPHTPNTHFVSQNQTADSSPWSAG